MRITYYALRTLTVGDEIRQPGDLVPEAGDWKYRAAIVAEGKIAPVLVASLPEETQEMLLDWYAETHPEVQQDPLPLGDDVEINKDGEDEGEPLEVTEPTDDVKPKRTRRTKAQIEADNAAAAEKEAV